MQYLETFTKWLNYENLDKEVRNELEKLDSNDVKEAFYKDLEFGTGGLRGLMGPGTNRINIYTIRKVTLGFANYLIKNNMTSNGVAISYDNRKNSKEFALEAAAVLAANNIKSFVFDTLRPTPMLSFAVRHFNCDGGIMITASHNPKEYNGYKVYNNLGAQTNLVESEQIIESINNVTNVFNINAVYNSDLVTIIDEEFDYTYLNEVRKIRLSNPKSSIKAVYSPLHGTGSKVIPKFLKAEGYDINPLESQMINDSNFPNTLSSNPEDAAAYIESINYANEIGAELVLVTDPDADRLGISVKHNNEFINLNGNQTAALMMYYILSTKKEKNTLPKNGAIFTTVVSSDLNKDIAKYYNLNVITTLTGFKFIGEQAELTKDKYEYLFGSEESYGSLVSPFVRDKDAVQAVYLLVEIASHLKDSGLTIIDFVNEMYNKFGLYYEYTNSITLSGIEGTEKISSTMEYVRNNTLELNDFEFKGKDDFNNQTYYDKTQMLLPKSNVIKLYYSNDLTVIFRPSGTEPKLKIYYSIKGNNQEELSNIITKLNTEIVKKLSL